jgi:hypothetical protein
MSKDKQPVEDVKDDDTRFKKIPMTPEQEKLVEKYKEQFERIVKEAFEQKK